MSRVEIDPNSGLTYLEVTEMLKSRKVLKTRCIQVGEDRLILWRMAEGTKGVSLTETGRNRKDNIALCKNLKGFPVEEVLD